MVIAVKEVGLVYRRPLAEAGRPGRASSRSARKGTRLRVEREGDEVARIIMTRFTAEYSFYRFTQAGPKRGAPPDAAKRRP